jgi:hypothetical protein
MADAAPCPSRPLPRGDHDPREFDGGAFGCYASRDIAPEGWWNGGSSAAPRQGRRLRALPSAHTGVLA